MTYFLDGKILSLVQVLFLNNLLNAHQSKETKLSVWVEEKCILHHCFPNKLQLGYIIFLGGNSWELTRTSGPPASR